MVDLIEVLYFNPLKYGNRYPFQPKLYSTSCCPPIDNQIPRILSKQMDLEFPVFPTCIFLYCGRKSEDSERSHVVLHREELQTPQRKAKSIIFKLKKETPPRFDALWSAAVLQRYWRNLFFIKQETATLSDSSAAKVSS